MSILAFLEDKAPQDIGELLQADLNDFVRSKITEAVNSLLEGEIEAMLSEAFRASNADFRNGYYHRHLKTSYGVIEARGIGDPRLFITDGLNGLGGAIKEAFPNARHQRCVVHVQRNVMVGVRRGDRKEIASDFKAVYSQETKGEALERLDEFIDKWSPSYPRVCRGILEIDDLLTFYDFPKASRQYIKTSNAIESFNSLLKRHSRKRILFNGEDNASLVIVQIAAKYNNDWAGRLVPFIKDLNEEERNQFGMCIIVE